MTDSQTSESELIETIMFPSELKAGMRVLGTNTETKESVERTVLRLDPVRNPAYQPVVFEDAPHAAEDMEASQVIGAKVTPQQYAALLAPAAAPRPAFEVVAEVTVARESLAL